MLGIMNVNPNKNRSNKWSAIELFQTFPKKSKINPFRAELQQQDNLYVQLRVL